MTIEHIRNFRDVSGYVNRYKETMKANRIFRGASLDQVTDAELEYMANELNIKYILDYRDEQEAKLAMDRLHPKMEYIRIGAMPSNGKGFDFGHMIQQGFNKELLQQMNAYLKLGYAQMPFDNPAYHKLFELLLKNDGNVYFHCSAGKDRTGVSAFLIMMALGVSTEDAIAEYLHSNDYLKQGKEELAKLLGIPSELESLCDPLLFVQKESIQCTIDAIQDKYSSYDEFLLKEYGLDQEKRKQLREYYCEK